MNFFQQKISELSVWHLLLGAFLVVLTALVVKDWFTTEQLVVTPVGNSFIKRSFLGGPLSSEAYAKYAKAKDDAIAAKDKAATKGK